MAARDLRNELLDGNAKHCHMGQDSRPKLKRATGSRPRLARPATPHHFLLLLIMMMTLMLVCCMMTTTNAAPNPNPEAAVGVIATAAGMAGKAIDLITVVGEMISPLPKSEPEIEPDPYPHHLDDSDDEEILPHDKEPKSPAGPASSAIEPMNPVMKMSAFRKFLMSVMEKFDAGLDPDAAAKKLKEEFVKSQDDTKSSLSLMPLESGVAVSSSSSNSQRPGRDSRTNLAPAKPSDNLMQQQLQASKVLAADFAKRQLTSPDGETNAVCGEHHDNCVVDCKVVCEPDSVNILVKFAYPFEGLVRLGNSPSSDCIVYWPGSNPKDTVLVAITSSTCAAERQKPMRERNHDEMFRVHIQFDKDHATHEDVNFVAQCTPGEKYAKEVKFSYTITDPMPAYISGAESSAAVFDVDVRNGISPDSPRLKGEIIIGTPLTLVLKMKAVHAYFLDLKVLSCWATFGEPTESFKAKRKNWDFSKMSPYPLELVQNGCSVRPNVFGNFHKVPSKPSDRELTYYALLRAFRFVDSDTVVTKCKVVLCYGHCPGNHKPCEKTMVEHNYLRGPSDAPEQKPTGTEEVLVLKESHKTRSERDKLQVPHSAAVAFNPHNEAAPNLPLLIPGHPGGAAEERPKRGTAILEAGLINIVDRGKLGKADGYYASNELGTTLLQSGDAIFWAKCYPRDTVAVTLNDPTGFTGAVTIHSPQSFRFPGSLGCGATKQTFLNAFDGLVLWKADCGHRPSSKYIIRVSNANGQDITDAILDCRKTSVILERSDAESPEPRTPFHSATNEIRFLSVP